MKYITIMGFGAILLASEVLPAEDLTTPVSGTWAAVCDAWGTAATLYGR